MGETLIEELKDIYNDVHCFGQGSVIRILDRS